MAGEKGQKPVDLEMAEILKKKAQKIIGRGNPPQPVGQPPVKLSKKAQAGEFTSMVVQRLDTLEQGLGNLGKSFQGFAQQTSQKVQQHDQMIQIISRPDLALDPLVDKWKNEFQPELYICAKDLFRIAISGETVESAENVVAIETVDGTIVVQKSMILMHYQKTPEMLEADIERKAEQELKIREAERQAKIAKIAKEKQEDGQASRDSKVTDESTKKSSK